MNHNSKQFKKLQDKWYKKLAEEGFEDIEQDEFYLKRASNLHFLLRSQNKNLDFEDVILRVTHREQYFRLAEHFLYEHKFVDALDRIIWEEHANGISHRTTVENLKKSGVKISRTTVLSRINKLKKVMLDKYKEDTYE